MKFRTTLILLCVFAVLLAAVLFFDSRGKKAAAQKEKEGKLVDLASSDIRKITLKSGAETKISMEKDEDGGWLITEPLQAKAETSEVESLVNSFSNLRFDRVVEEAPADLLTYGIPQQELWMWVQGREDPVRILIGMENPLDKTLFAKREDETRVVLLASYLKTSLDKSVFDFRTKDIFQFQAGEVMSLRLRAPDIRWEADRVDEDWHFTSPVNALADNTQVDGILNSLSGLKAKEFVSEIKSPEDIRTYGLETPEYEIVLGLPAASKTLVFSLHKADDRFYATTSESTKIILFEGSLLDDLQKKIDDLREKKVFDFYSWEADRISLSRGDFRLTAVKEKTENETGWVFETEAKEAADASKIESFIRKVEALEAAEFVDSPGELSRYGLTPPAAEITIRTRGSDEKIKEAVLLIGREDTDRMQVTVKNPAFDYLFRVDSAFLQDFPKESKDWAPPPPEPPVEKKDERQ